MGTSMLKGPDQSGPFIVKEAIEGRQKVCRRAVSKPYVLCGTDGLNSLLNAALGRTLSLAYHMHNLLRRASSATNRALSSLCDFRSSFERLCSGALSRLGHGGDCLRVETVQNVGPDTLAQRTFHCFDNYLGCATSGGHHLRSRTFHCFDNGFGGVINSVYSLKQGSGGRSGNSPHGHHYRRNNALCCFENGLRCAISGSNHLPGCVARRPKQGGRARNDSNCHGDRCPFKGNNSRNKRGLFHRDRNRARRVW